MYKHILIPIDLAKPQASDKAVVMARNLARSHGARVSALAVVPTWAEDLLGQEPHDWQPELDAYLASISDGLEIASEVKEGGSISTRIIQAIHDKGIDLVVMASHDPRVTDYLIGSNAAHVVLHAPCSVLVVR